MISPIQNPPPVSFGFQMKQADGEDVCLKSAGTSRLLLAHISRVSKHRVSKHMLKLPVGKLCLSISTFIGICGNWHQAAVKAAFGTTPKACQLQPPICKFPWPHDVSLLPSWYLLCCFSSRIWLTCYEIMPKLWLHMDTKTNCM